MNWACAVCYFNKNSEEDPWAKGRGGVNSNAPRAIMGGATFLSEGGRRLPVLSGVLARAS